ncbi:pilus assembly protein [Acinetobacter pragensis]|uniref:Pilus assembly protein PilY n=1 Tax=Acinetobacter pragensis TaxID=1806892 RepID=A0A151Y1C7_9GAMM|nr:PilC/PilY family type IV pilus protein [Acinetobacter pragensis]KYQ71878.1 pilus assembly protein PilY [Acinetobacter pragensis]
MNMKYKKLVVAIQSAIMTSLICSALPSHASDIELYKSPQATQTTLMFMMDVSGSMDYCDNANGTVNKDEGCTPNRISKLKQGMLQLLQGDASAGVEALPDRLVTGLSEFSGSSGTGRIKLEARPLSEMTVILNAQVYREIQAKSGMVSITGASKIIETGQKREGNGSWVNYTIEKSVNTGSPITYPVNNQGSKIFQECLAWDVNAKCTQWINTEKKINEFGSVASISTKENVNVIPQNWIKSGSETLSSREDESCGRRCTIQYRNVNEQKYTATSGSVTYDEYMVYTGTAENTHRKKMIREVLALTANGGTPTDFAYGEVAAYLMGTTTKGESGSGFDKSSANSLIQDGSNYIKPSYLNTSVTPNQREYTINSAKQCNTQGIYFLTDGEPSRSNDSNVNFFKKTLGTKANLFSCTSTPTPLHSDKGIWNCIGSYAQALLDPSRNPAGVQIKTAVVGFGNDFTDNVSDPSDNVKNAKKWGEVGGGGWYSAEDSVGVVTSVNAFLKKLQKYIPPVTTGSVTIPVDNLDTQNVQPWGYFPQFDPQPDSKVNTWIGNLKKYEVVNNVLLDRDGKNVIDATTKISVDDPNDFWSDNSIKKTITKIKRVGTADIEEDIEVRVGGALSQFKLGMVDSKERKIFTDRKIDAQGVNSAVSDDSNLVQVKTADLKVLNTANNFSKDPKRGYIASLFGYDVGATMAKGLEDDTSTATQTNFANYLTNNNATLRQMGAVMHSKPVLITQSGTTSYNDETGDLTYTDRDDLIVFGSTQGLLHIVRAGKTRTDSDAGKEVFTFMPTEMVDGQSQGFLNQTQQGSDLKYGIDGQWTAYTEYVTKSGTEPTEPVVTVKGGKQWLYGGLRMGGKSYYALDLSDVTSDGGTPKLKFRIDPATSLNSAIRHMGQSWSKPTLTWVNWKGSRKLVMIVGGGYDTAYESLTFNPSSSIDQGAGVYMFDANDGSLLWWSSANVASGSTSNTETYAANMKRSVVSQIKAVDRNNDGLADHLYFGDLGGQVWRVDLNASNKAGDTENFAKRAVRILNMSSAANVPRFYSTPTFTIHSSVNGYFGVVTVGSGNLSFPMSESNQNDALYVVYDKDVAKRNLSVLKESELSTVDVSTSAEADGKKLAVNTAGNTGISLTFGGWYYPLSTKNRMLNDNVAIDNDLYISVFDSTVDITDVDCVGGVRGKSIAQQFCLPFGQCMKKDSAGNNVPDTRPDDIELGRGNIGISFGGIDKKRGLVLNLPTDKTLKSYQGKTKFISQRWYER